MYEIVTLPIYKSVDGTNLLNLIFIDHENVIFILKLIKQKETKCQLFIYC